MMRGSKQGNLCLSYGTIDQNISGWTYIWYEIIVLLRSGGGERHCFCSVHLSITKIGMCNSSCMLKGSFLKRCNLHVCLLPFIESHIISSFLSRRHFFLSKTTSNYILDCKFLVYFCSCYCNYYILSEKFKSCSLLINSYKE